MPHVDLNYAAILVAAIAPMLLGMVWYSPALFGKTWVKLLGKNEQEMKKMGKQATNGYILTFVSALIMSYVLAHFVDYTMSTTAIQGVETGFWLWLGFVATTGMINFVWQNKHRNLYVIDNGYHLVSLMVMGAILAMWV